jgi:site-specific DNA recombinase
MQLDKSTQTSINKVDEKTLYCYLRVSTQGQVDEGHSIENQRHLGKKVADKLGMKYFEMNEGGLSSVSSVRPVYEELKEGIRIGRIKNIWYFSRSRWTRNTIEDLLVKKNYFIPNKTNVYEGDSGTKRNFHDAKDEMLDTILTSVQQFDRQQRREVSVSGKRHLSRQNGESGVFMGGTINFGYANVDKKWTINKEEGKYVKKIFSLYLQDKSLQEIKSYLDTRGVKPRRSKLWSIGTLLSIVKNRVYLGEYTWTDKDTKEEFSIVVPSIISHSLFNRVQKKIQKNTRNTGNNSRQYTSLLSDFLECYCGENVTGNVRMSVNKKVYLCSSKRNKWKGKDVEICENRRGMNMDLTDELVVSKVKEVMGNSSILKEKFKTDVMSKKSVDSSQIELEKKFLENKIKILDKQIDLTIKSISTNEVNHMLKKTEDGIYKQIKLTLDEEKGGLEDKKSQFIKEIDELDNRKDWIDWITKYGDDISKRFEKPTTELLEGMIDTIVVSPIFALNRDEIEKQVGHKIVVNFLQPIVDDSIVYQDEQNKSKGYNVVKGNKELDVGSIDILKGGRGKKKQKY